MAVLPRLPRFRPVPALCPECDSEETIRTSETKDETLYLCRDCDHVWSSRPRAEAGAVPPLMPHSVERALAVVYKRTRRVRLKG
jgi:NMD protein affecting ribosome stability and mRNA decay